MATDETTPSTDDGQPTGTAEATEALQAPDGTETTDVVETPELDLPLPASDETAEAEDPEDEPADEDEDESQEDHAPALSVPSFGLLFQAPEPVAPRRSSRRAPQPDEDEEPAPADDAPESSAVAGATDDAPAAEQDGQGDDTQDDGQPRRRRRRGGRGRNKGESTADESGDTPSEDEDGGSEEETEQASKGGRGSRRRGGKKADAAEDAQGEDETPDDDEGEDSADSGDDEGSGGSSRRRRRRRRGSGGSGGGSGDSQDDPPGTVTKVREGRKERNEPQAVKGSTRLEAKKQRRREGREAGRRRTIITEAEFLARRESVERTMIVRSSGERTQIGVLEDDVLVEHYVSRETTSTMVGNVYLGRVQNVLPSMEAAFVDIGKGRNAVLYAGEVNWDAHGVGNGQARRIEHALSSGDTVLVQVTKDPIGHKGARLTSQVSLPGRYLVYVPEGSMTGISRKLPDKERARLKSILKEVVPDSAGVIVRTAAEGASEEELKKDVERLTAAWERIREKAESKKGKKGGAPAVLHAEPDMTVRVIRDIFNEDFARMVVSGDSAWREIKGYVDDVAPDLADRLERWTGERDVFAEHRIDEQIAKAMDRKVWLPSGGSLVIDRTEAMTVVDVNTGKFVGSGGNLEETVTKNNIEAAEEIVRQLRLRDIGGIIVIDFIDMVLEANRDLVVRRLLECLGRDRTKHQVAEVTSLGLVQMTRKRVGSGLIEVFSETCECCNGRGIIVHSEPVAVDSSGGSSGGDEQGGSRSRRSKGKGSKGEEQPSSKGPAKTPEPQTDKNGRTAAQIAAAAHAAAIKNVSGEAVEDDVAELADTAAPEVEGTDEATVPEVRGTDEGTIPEVRGTSLEGTDQAPQDEPEEARAPRRRRGGRRAASSGAPVTLQPVDLTAPQTVASAPITAIAGEVADATEGGAGTTPSAEPEAPAAPARKKRKRVTSEAGPPSAPPADAGLNEE